MKHQGMANQKRHTKVGKPKCMTGKSMRQKTGTKVPGPVRKSD